MGLFLLKTILAAILISYCSWLAGKKPALAGFVLALPTASMIALLFSYFEHQNTQLTTEFAKGIFIGVPVSLLFFVPFLLAEKFQLHFYTSFALGIACMNKNRVVKVEEKLIYGTQEQLQRALENSPRSSKINTSYIERLNLTIRQSLAHLSRKSLAHSRCQLCLNEQLKVFQCYYNFVRSHSSLKMGNINKTPAMEAGIAKRSITFREIFSVVADYFCNIFKIRLRLFILYSW